MRNNIWENITNTTTPMNDQYCYDNKPYYYLFSLWYSTHLLKNKKFQVKFVHKI